MLSQPLLMETIGLDKLACYNRPQGIPHGI